MEEIEIVMQRREKCGKEVGRVVGEGGNMRRVGGVKVVGERGRKKWKEVSGGRDESVE